MAPGKRVLALQEERAGQLQPHPHQRGVVHQDRAEQRNRLVQLRLAVRLRQVRAGLHGGHAGVETGGNVGVRQRRRGPRGGGAIPGGGLPVRDGGEDEQGEAQQGRRVENSRHGRLARRGGED